MKLFIFIFTFLSAVFSTFLKPIDDNNLSIGHTSEVDSTAIRTLIINVLKGSNSNNSPRLLLVIALNNDSVYNSIDLKKHKQNLHVLSQTNYFSKEFIENLNKIILTLERQLKSDAFKKEPWHIGEMPPFNFYADNNPWCLCQDNLDWNKVQIKKLEVNNYTWFWGDLPEGLHSSWKEFKCSFSVIKEDET